MAGCNHRAHAQRSGGKCACRREELILDFGFLEYVSSAGLRVILTAQDIMDEQDEMKVIRVNETAMEIF